MSRTKNNGGTAFPVVSDMETLIGMSKRDYFAAKALQGLLASLAHPEGTTPRMLGFDQLAKDAFDLADEMLKAREL